jgi:hypothetical protein
MAADEVRTVPNLISDLRTWFESRKDAFAGLGLIGEFNDSPSDRSKRSASVTLASPRRVGQLVVWETGEAELSLGDVGSDSVVEEHREITSQIGMQDATETLLGWLEQ